MKILPITKCYNVNKCNKPKNDRINGYVQNQDSVSFGKKNKTLIYILAAVFATIPIPLFIIKNKQRENLE